MKKIIDSHIHLDQYHSDEVQSLLNQLSEINCERLISVSSDLQSCKKNQQLALLDKRIHPAYGFHPEQALPSDIELQNLIDWMSTYRQEMVAIGEIGLPYYLRKKQPHILLHPYIELLNNFLTFANRWNKPVVLHAIYEDAPIVCDLLEKQNITRAHFHWFKGDHYTIKRMIENSYFISIAPDVMYEKEIQQLVEQYPIHLMLVETDGPWPFDGMFANQLTQPHMIHHIVHKIAQLKKLNALETYQIIYENTLTFYQL